MGVQSLPSAMPELDGEAEEALLNVPSVNPIILVPGFLGPAKDDRCFDSKSSMYSYWGEAGSLGTSNNPVLSVWPSGFSSLHDRACEIFYQIKGGTVDYGEEHSLRSIHKSHNKSHLVIDGSDIFSCRCGHARFGRTYHGLFPGDCTLIDLLIFDA
jgi:hypothetical protein